MIKSQLTGNISGRFLHRRIPVVERAVNVVLDEIAVAMAMRNRVELRGFGSFYVKNRGGRNGRNPKSGVKIRVAGKTVPVFRPSKEMHKRLNLIAP